MKFTSHQRTMMRDLCKEKIALHFLGVEPGTEDPVVWIKDAARSFPMVIRYGGNGSIATVVRPLTEEEELGLDERDADVVLSIPKADFRRQPELLEVREHGEEG